MERVIKYTNAKLESWYVNAKKDFGVIGSGICSIKSNGELVIDYIENGIKKSFSLMYWEDQEVSWAFNVWSEKAN